MTDSTPNLRRLARVAPVATLLLSACAVPCRADLVFPAAVKVLSAPGPHSLLIFPAPLLAFVSLLEALVARRFLGKRPLFPLFLALFFINGFTTAIGFWTMPNGTELWPGVPLAWAGTTVIEFPLLLLFLKKGQRDPLLTLRISALMNLASYAFLTCLLAAAIYLPAMSCRNDLPRSELTGRLSVLDVNGRVIRTIGLGHGKSRLTAKRDDRFGVEYKGRERLIVDRKYGRTVGHFAPGYLFKGLWEISDDGRFYANWVCADASRGVGAGDLVVGDSRTGKVEVFRDPQVYLFQPSGSRLAIFYDGHVIIYDCTSRRRVSIKTPCISRRGSCWSPDGRYIAYLADMSPNTHGIGDSYTDAVRVVSATTGKSVTLLREDHECDWWSIDWTP